MKIVLTGATGFIGSKILNRLLELEFQPTIVLRTGREFSISVPRIEVESIDQDTPWKKSLEGYEVVIHAAARVHVLNDSDSNSLTEYRKVNTFGTLNLARHAALSGVKRFIFVSSVKALGEESIAGRVYTSSDKPSPTDFYGISKYEAEEGLKKIAEETGLEVVIIRPPLVYGPGVKANFEAMLRIVSKRIPLPFGCIQNNQRSFVFIDNLVDLIITCINHPRAANKNFLVSDDEELSTSEIFQRIGIAFGKPVFMIPVPILILKLAFRSFGKSYVINRLCGNFQVDISETKSTLNWKPIITGHEGFSRTVKQFMLNKERLDS